MEAHMRNTKEMYNTYTTARNKQTKIRSNGMVSEEGRITM